VELEQKRGEGYFVSEQAGSCSADVLMALRPAYTVLSRRIDRTDSIDEIVIPSMPLDSEKLTDGLRTALTEAQKLALSRVKRAMSGNTYKAVVTDRAEIAEQAFESRIPFVLLQRGHELKYELMAERNPYSYCINISKKGWTDEFVLAIDEILRSYKQPEPEAEEIQSAHKVLVVDDRTIDLKLYGIWLGEEAGHEVVTAETTDEALSILSKGGIGCLVADITYHNTSSIDGLGLLGKVKDLYPSLPVIIQSSHKEKEQEAMLLGAYGFVFKSSDGREQLLSLVGEALKQKGLSTTPFSDGTVDRLIKEAEEGDASEATRRFSEEFDRSLAELAEKPPF